MSHISTADRVCLPFRLRGGAPGQVARFRRPPLALFGLPILHRLALPELGRLHAKEGYLSSER